MAHIEAIASVEGVGGIFIGPADLAASFGYPGQPGHPEVVEAIENAIILYPAQAPREAGGNSHTGREVRGTLHRFGNAVHGRGVDVALLAPGAEALAGRFAERV